MIGKLLALKTLESMFRFVIKTMPEEFDSHDFIAAVVYQHPDIYIRALQAKALSHHPFEVVNEEIIQHLSTNSLVKAVGKRNSENMFKQLKTAIVWKRFEQCGLYIYALKIVGR